MDDTKKNTTTQQSPSDCHIPPPTDPYITYQTPYTRKPSEETQNPFIEFRRLADSAFTSFFNGLPRVLGTEKFKEANIRQTDQEYAKAFDQQARKFEEQIAEMVRERHERQESFQKQLEQEWEERRNENEKRMEEENQRWEMMRRGLEKCPGLRPDSVNPRSEAESELDLYDGLKAYEAAAFTAVSDAERTNTQKCPWKDEKIEKKCPWNEEQGRHGWMSGLGWDGKRRAKNIPLYVPRSDKDDTQTDGNTSWREYDDDEMDPFNNDDHVVPWLKLSPYSPLSLISSPTLSETFAQARNTRDLKRALSEMPWDEAFEDLMSVHRTGKLPSLIRRLVYWGGPNQWMTDLALRGSLGPRWEEGFMVAGLMNAVDGNQWRGFDGFRESCKQLAGREFTKSVAQTSNTKHVDDGDDSSHAEDDAVEPSLDEWTKLVRSAFEPQAIEAYRQMEDLAQALFGESRSVDKTYGARSMPWPSPEEVISALVEGRFGNAGDSGSETIESSDEGKQTLSTSVKPWSSSSPSNTSSHTLESENRPESLVSTFTNTTTRTLPDGSIEITRVLKKRFADGREENSESVETKPARRTSTSDNSTQTTDTKSQAGGKGGWFWN